VLLSKPALIAMAVVRRRRRINLEQARIEAMTGRRGNFLVITQVALSFALLFVAGLLSRTLTNLQSTDAGFKSQSVFLARLMSQPNRPVTPETRAYYQELGRRLAELPTVRSISTSLLFPLTFDETGFLETVETSETGDQAKPVRAAMEVVSPGFFETVGIRRLEGRDFTWQDDKDRPAVAVINETWHAHCSRWGAQLVTVFDSGRIPAGARSRLLVLSTTPASGICARFMCRSCSGRCYKSRG
jgi:hypothetical protein